LKYCWTIGNYPAKPSPLVQQWKITGQEWPFAGQFPIVQQI